MGLWDNIEQNNQNDHIEEIDNQDFTNEIYRKSLIKNLVDYSVDNNITDELCENLSINLQSIPKDKKEKILEIFTKNSKLLNSNNSYLSNPIKGMRLISSIINTKDMKEKNELELLFDRFDDFLNDDFIKFSSQISIPNEAKPYKELINIRNELFEDIKFSELINKTHIGIGGSFSAGKSSFLNSILDRDINSEDILPTDTNPTTSIPTYIVKQRDSKSINNNINIYTFNKNGKKSKIDRESLLAISHEFDKIYNFGLISIIEKIVIDIKDMPYENIAFLDTPGYSKSDGAEEIDKNIALNHLQNINSLIWLIDIDNGVIRDGDIKFIQSLNFKGDILFVINKADKKPPNDIKKILEFVRNTLKKANIDFVDIVAYSSHDKKEYFSKRVIDNFLIERNWFKCSVYKYRFLNIINQYENILESDIKNKKNTLRILHEIDLLSKDITDIESLLISTKNNINNAEKQKDKLRKIKKAFIEFGNSFDNYFNDIGIDDKLFFKNQIEKNKIIKILPTFEKIFSVKIINLLINTLMEDTKRKYFDKEWGYLEDNNKFDIICFISNIAFYYAIENNNMELAKFFVYNSRINFNINLEKVYSFLYIVIENNDIEIVKSLLNRKNNIDINKAIRIVEEVSHGIFEEIKITPLYIALKNNNLEMIKLLLEYGAYINEEISSYKDTPLHLAVKKNNLKIVKLLLNYGADKNKKNIYNETPLFRAVSLGFKNIEDILKNN